MVRDEFTLVDFGHEGSVDDGSADTERPHVARRQHALLSEGFGGQQFDLQHRVETVRIAEERRDVNRGVSGDHPSPLDRFAGDVGAHNLALKGYE